MPNGGIGAIAIVDAGYYPTAQSDLDAFDSYFGIPATTITQVWPGPIRPPVYRDWEVEEALDIEWAHAMAPQAKLFLVVSALCKTPECATDPTWQAVQLAGNLVAQNGGGVVSMSFGDAEIPQETGFDQYFTHPGSRLLCSLRRFGTWRERLSGSVTERCVGWRNLFQPRQ